jgi:outer membrane protein TolC
MIAEGVATRADGLSVKVRLNEAELAKTKVENGLALSRMLLAQVCGLPLGQDMVLADETITPQPASQYTESEQDSWDIDWTARPELRSLELATKIYSKKERLVLADMLPSLAFSANYLVTNPNSFHGFKHEFGGMFQAGLMVKFPLSAWWEGSYKHNAARAETLIKTLEYEDARDKISLQVSQSLYSVNEARKKLSASYRNMENAEENLHYANVGFEEGLIPVLNLMEAQTAWVSAQSELIDAQIEVKLSGVYMAKALGKLLPKQE